MTVIDELDEALLDVRKAYRLAFLYQRRVVDLCEEIRKALSEDLIFYYWTPSCCIFPKRDLPSSQDARAFLPLYGFCVFYLPNGVDNTELRAGDWMLTVRIAADSDNHEDDRHEPDPLQFNDVANCESTVRLYVYYCSQPLTANWYSKVFLDNQWPRDSGEGSFDQGIRTFGCKFPLSRMATPEGVFECVGEFARQVGAVLPLKFHSKNGG